MPEAFDLPPFTDLFFGMADAKNEADMYPVEFETSFVDHHNVVERLREGSKFLLLGPKGAGKSAAAWYVERTSQATSMLVDTRDISELPLDQIGNIKTGEAGGTGRVVTAWRLLVLCALLDVLLQDQSIVVGLEADAHKVIKELRKVGFLDPTPTRAVVTSSKTTLTIPIPSVGTVFSRESVSSLQLHHLVPYLEQWCSTQGENSYRLFLDGLDSIYLNDPQYIPSISALVQAVYLVNQSLAASNSSARIVLLARSDIFSRLALSDAGKLRTDFGVEMDWRLLAASSKPETSPLFRMVNEKAGARFGSPVQVVKTYLPETVTLGRSSTPMPVHQYLLNLTRHTPRDLLQLLDHIRQAAVDLALDDDGKVSQEVLREGVDRYAVKYFVDAIRNELVGRGQHEVDAFMAINALRDMEQDQFKLSDYTRSRFGNTPSADDIASAKELMRWFFYAGAVGNIVAGFEKSYLQFFHRRDDSDVHINGSLKLHNALTYAWATPRTRRRRTDHSINRPRNSP